MTAAEHQEPPAWSRDPEVLERVFLEAVGQGDADGVEAALRLMVVVDPRRAQRLYDDLKFGLRFVQVLTGQEGTG